LALEPIIALGSFIVIAIFLWWLFRAERGFFWRWQKARRLNERILREDALKHVHRCERYGRQPSMDSLAGALQLTANKAAGLVSNLETHGLLEHEGGSFRLTPEGQDYALHIIRAHRLWERYLADETGFDEEDWHERAEQLEHSLTPVAADALAAELGFPTHDPHGDPIPTATGKMVAHGGQPLTALSVNDRAQIVHLEDEPEALFAQIVAEGLSVGMVIQLVELSSRRVRFWANGDEHVLAPIVAANISVIPIAEVEEPTEPGDQLSNLRPGEKGKVINITRTSRGSERRRFLDLGILPGTVITAEMASPSGDPTAYRIRDALIALRREQAALIRIERMVDEG